MAGIPGDFGVVSGDSRMVRGEVVSKLHSGGPFRARLYSNSESNLPKVEVAGSITVSRSSLMSQDIPDTCLKTSWTIAGGPALSGRGRVRVSDGGAQ